MSLPFLFGEALALPFSASYHLRLLMLVCFRCCNLTSSQVLRFVFWPCLRSTCQVPFSLDPAPPRDDRFFKGLQYRLVVVVLFWSCFFVIFILLSLLSVSSLFVTPCVLWLFFCYLLFYRLSVSSWLCYVPFVSRLLFRSLFYKLFFCYAYRQPSGFLYILGKGARWLF